MICGWGRMAAQGCSKRCAGAVERRLAQHERRHCVRVGSSGGRGGLAQGAAVTVEVAAPSNTTEAHPVGRPGTQQQILKALESYAAPGLSGSIRPGAIPSNAAERKRCRSGAFLVATCMG